MSLIISFIYLFIIIMNMKKWDELWLNYKLFKANGKKSFHSASSFSRVIICSDRHVIVSTRPSRQSSRDGVMKTRGRYDTACLWYLESPQSNVTVMCVYYFHSKAALKFSSVSTFQRQIFYFNYIFGFKVSDYGKI